nr:putative ribonuclease H-like domain-containing protein [Tanacetum cinerariifolium]
MEILTVESLIPTVSSPVLTVYSTNSQEPSSDARLILKRVANQEETPSLDNILSLTNRFEDILGVTTNSDESNGVKADISNMETAVTASPTPTLRIHKDHPKSQIIGPLDTPIQTRNKSKEVEKQSFIATIHQKTDLTLFQFCLFSCFLSQIEPKKIFDALQDPSWVEAIAIGTKWVLKNKKDERGIVIKNKARLVTQGHTQEEGIDYDKVFAPVAKIEAIRLFLAYASFMAFTVYHMDVKSAFLYDNLGKFEEKRDEGYFIEYSMSSKAFRVFNKRTRRVKENLHVEFLENKAIEKGADPNWLFDIDFLTKSINYVPVDAGTISTNLSGTKDATSQEAKKDVSSLRYIALPNWAYDALLEYSLSKPQDHYSTEVPEGSGNLNPTASTSNPPADQMETLTLETLISTVSSPVLTAYFTDSQEPSSDTRLISKRVANQEETPSLDNILTLTNRFEDILGVTRSSDEANGVWVEAMHEEHLQFKIQNVWTLVDCPKGVRPIGTKWVLKNKKDERGIVIRNKARLVGQGHTQEEGIDYDEVFAPVVRIEAIRLFLAYASFMGFIVYQMDVKSAFLYGTIDEEVYVMQPPGFQVPEFLVKEYKVEKAMGTIDQTLFIIRQREDFILLQVYVDDIIFGSSNPQLCREFKALMHEKFKMSAMGELNFFLGLQVLQKDDGIFLSQDKYVGDLLKKFGYSEVRSLNTPMDKENPWGKDGTGKDVDLHLYRSMIGSLMYLTASRPDIMFDVCAYDRHQVTPKECHLHVFIRIFRYLKGHPKLGLWYPKESHFNLVAYSDSDYGGATQDRKSTTEGC